MRSAANAQSYEGGRSLVGVLAEKIADAGRDGLRAFAYQQERGGVGIIFRSPEAGQDVNIPQDLTAIVLGASVVAVEQMLGNREYFHNRFIEQINDRLTGTRFGKFAVPEQHVKWRRIGRGDWEQMVEAARRDPTLSTFFYEQNRHILPEKMQEFLKYDVMKTGKSFFEYMESMLPWYSALANALVVRRLTVQVPEVFDSNASPTGTERVFAIRGKLFSDYDDS